MDKEQLGRLKAAIADAPAGALKDVVTDLVARNEAWRAAFPAGALIRSRDGRDQGVLTGREKECPIEDCAGYMFQVRWPDGCLSWVCTTDTEPVPDGQGYMLCRRDE
jgi:hypothetical protein